MLFVTMPMIMGPTVEGKAADPSIDLKSRVMGRVYWSVARKIILNPDQNVGVMSVPSVFVRSLPISTNLTLMIFSSSAIARDIYLRIVAT